jgi:hypothetical protein
MPAPTCFSALAIEKDAMGEIALGDLRAAQSEIAAKCLAAAMAATKPAAVAFSHTGDLSSGNLANVVILESYGDLPNGVLRPQGAATEKVGDRRKRRARRQRASGGVMSRWPSFAELLRRHS